MKAFLMAFSAALLLSSASLSKADDLKWFPGTSNSVSLLYGEPATDNLWFSADCNAKSKIVMVMMTIESTALPKRVSPNSNDYVMTVKIGADEFRLIGKLEPDDLMNAHSFTVLLTPDDRFLARFASDSKSNITYGSAIVPLDKASVSGMQRVIKSCGLSR